MAVPAGPVSVPTQPSRTGLLGPPATAGPGGSVGGVAPDALGRSAAGGGGAAVAAWPAWADATGAPGAGVGAVSALARLTGAVVTACAEAFDGAARPAAGLDDPATGTAAPEAPGPGELTWAAGLDVRTRVPHPATRRDSAQMTTSGRTRPRSTRSG
jgi:hypothetical protein